MKPIHFLINNNPHVMIPLNKETEERLLREKKDADKKAKEAEKALKEKRNA